MAGDGGGGTTPEGSVTWMGRTIEFRDVWEDNFEEVVAVLRELVKDYPVIGLCTSFPGLVVRPLGEFKTETEFMYAVVRENVNLTRALQVGIAFCNDRGENPRAGAFRFHLQFNAGEEVCVRETVERVTGDVRDGTTKGSVSRYREEGIDPARFAAALTTSGLVLMPTVSWVTFGGAFDLAHFLRTLSGRDLPATREDFFTALARWVPVFYDTETMALRLPGEVSRRLPVGSPEVSVLDLCRLLRIDALPDPGVAKAPEGTTAPPSCAATAVLSTACFHAMRDRVSLSSLRGHLHAISSSAPPAARPARGHAHPHRGKPRK